MPVSRIVKTQIGPYKTAGSQAWVDFCKFVIESLQDGPIFIWPPEYFVKKYPQHAWRLRAIMTPEGYASLGRRPMLMGSSPKSRK
jgi:hypothetical protein